LFRSQTIGSEYQPIEALRGSRAIEPAGEPAPILLAGNHPEISPALGSALRDDGAWPTVLVSSSARPSIGCLPAHLETTLAQDFGEFIEASRYGFVNRFESALHGFRSSPKGEGIHREEI
jgi:hypothetical protein